LQLVLIACFGFHYDKTAMSLAVIEKLGALIPELFSTSGAPRAADVPRHEIQPNFIDSGKIYQNL
jgi:hypothetical protein